MYQVKFINLNEIYELDNILMFFIPVVRNFVTLDMSVSIPTAPSHHLGLSLLFFHRLIIDKNIGKIIACRGKKSH
jgi:hypothetical protein